MTIEAIRADREAVAAERAATLPAGEYYASGNFVCDRDRRPVLECETHWDAVLVIMAPRAGHP